MEDIVRDPEKSDMSKGPDSEYGIDVPLITTKGKYISPKDRFAAKIATEEQKAIKQGLPFASAVARADVEDINKRLANQLKRQGYITEEYKTIGIDWNKYSNLKNFELIEEGEQHDPKQSERHRLPIYVKWKKYQFKGFSNIYTVMEPVDQAVKRAQLELEESSAKRLKAVIGGSNASGRKA